MTLTRLRPWRLVLACQDAALSSYLSNHLRTRYCVLERNPALPQTMEQRDELIDLVLVDYCPAKQPAITALWLNELSAHAYLSKLSAQLWVCSWPLPLRTLDQWLSRLLEDRAPEL
jgi:hypothetical protein